MSQAHTSITQIGRIFEFRKIRQKRFDHVKRNLSDVITTLEDSEHNNTFSQYVKLNYELNGIVCSFGHTHFLFGVPMNFLFLVQKLRAFRL